MKFNIFSCFCPKEKASIDKIEVSINTLPQIVAGNQNIQRYWLANDQNENNLNTNILSEEYSYPTTPNSVMSRKPGFRRCESTLLKDTLIRYVSKQYNEYSHDSTPSTPNSMTIKPSLRKYVSIQNYQYTPCEYYPCAPTYEQRKAASKFIDNAAKMWAVRAALENRLCVTTRRRKSSI